MREIKFRAWDEDKVNWLSGDKIKGDMHYSLEEAQDDMDILDILAYYDNNYVFMQNTGIKGKNGEEIYEGDFVKYNCGGRDMFGEICGDVIAGCVDRDKTGLKDFMCRDNGFYEVVGNIYENPDLIVKITYNV